MCSLFHPTPIKLIYTSYQLDRLSSRQHIKLIGVMTDSRAPSQKLDQYMVRFPDGLRDRIKNAAAENNRSMNAEIIARLEQSYSGVTHRFDESLDINATISVELLMPYYLLKALQAHEGYTSGTEADVILRILHEYFPGSPSMEDLAEAEVNLLNRAQDLYSFKDLDQEQRDKLERIQSAALDLTQLMELARKRLNQDR